MKVRTTDLPGVLVLEPQVHADARGWLCESFSQQAFAQATGSSAVFVQDIHSLSHYGVLRGLHWQAAPYQQGKLLRVLRGHIWDVVVDIRPQSPHFKHWQGLDLDAQSPQWLWIPPGFAHGFLCLSEASEVLYKTTAPYAPEHQRSWAWDDPALGITWPRLANDQKPQLSLRDAHAPQSQDQQLGP